LPGDFLKPARLPVRPYDVFEEESGAGGKPEDKAARPALISEFYQGGQTDGEGSFGFFSQIRLADRAAAVIIAGGWFCASRQPGRFMLLRLPV
jgi:hypothetical protein